MVFPPGAGVDIEHADGMYTLGELACTISHLRAIKQAFDDGAMTALITDRTTSRSHRRAHDRSPLWI
eukprot:6132495-Prymnesium_polylepis.1